MAAANAKLAAAPGPPEHLHAHLADPARPYLAGLLLALAAAFLLAHWFAPAPWQGSLAAYFLAYTLEAIPFILLGALLSGLMEMLLPVTLLPRLTARLKWLGVPVAALLSPLFPTCECGVIAIGRGLLRKGLPLGPALAYLLAAPILNPTVLWTTWLAFQDWRYVAWRALGGLLVACAVGWTLGRVRLPDALQDSAQATAAPAPPAPAPPGPRPPLSRRLLHAFTHVRQDFSDMLLYFLCGVALAAAMKVFLSASVLTHAGRGAVSGPAAMMGTAFLLSLCSEADAFPAAGFTEFTFPAIITFLVFGPMLDLKLLLMYRGLWRGRFLAWYILAITAGVGLLALLLTLLGGAR